MLEAKMPRLMQPLTMRKCALQSVAEHLEIICYGCVGRGAEMRRMIQDDSYLVTINSSASIKEIIFKY